MNARKTWTIAGGALFAVAAVIFGWPWVALGIHASGYPVTGAGDAANVVVEGANAFASRATRGFEVLDLTTGKRIAEVPPPRGSESVDDLAVAGRFLFTLDARPPGHLSVFSIDDPSKPVLVSGPVDVAVGPFSGVSAANGRVIVSGGTSLMSLRTYDARGKLSDVLSTGDFGRGQPDVLLAPDGTRAFVSTHSWGPYFGVTTVRVGDSFEPAGTLDLDTYGFTDGGAKPASFPLETAIDGDTLFVADLRGLTVLSVADLARPRVLAKLDLGVKAVNVDVRDHVAAIVGASPSPRLVLVDVASPSSPHIIRSIELDPNSHPTGVAIGAAHIAVATRQRILIIPKEKS
jgi:hypothetical protein